MRISQSLLKALNASLDKGWFNYTMLEELLGGREEALLTLLEGYSLGLYRLRGEDTFEIREEGRRILEAWRKAGSPSTDPWIDSRIYTMLQTVRTSGVTPEEWKPILADRGLIDAEGRLSDAARELLAVTEGLERYIVITKGMARALAKMPEGPARREDYGRYLPVLEAMGLAVGTVPLNPYYILTLPGKLLAKAMRRLNLDAPLPSIVNPPVLAALEKASREEELTPEEKTLLGTLGYLKATGALDYPGRLVLHAIQALRKPRLYPPMAIPSLEENVLRAVVEAWREHEEKPNVIPDKERITRYYEKLTGERIDASTLGLALLHLESMGLIEETSIDEAQAYKPTRQGEELAQGPGAGRGAPVTAVKSITWPNALLSPSTRWVEDAIEHAIVAVGGPTARGELLARLSETPRSPLITKVEAVALQRIPEEKSVSLDALGLGESGESPVEIVSRLEARGIVEVLPDERVRLTRAGRLLKTALLGVPSGIAVPVSPVLIRVLRAVEELRTTDPATLVNETRLSLGTVKDALVLARQAKYLGRGWSLTAAGRALLEAADLLLLQQ